jgi:hypothetical protein
MPEVALGDFYITFGEKRMRFPNTFNTIIRFALLVLIVQVFGTSVQSTATVAQSARLNVEPTAEIVTVGEKFSVAIQAETVGQPVTGLEFELSYDANLLQFNTAEASSLLTTASQPALCAPAAQPSPGVVRFACVGNSAQTTSGTLANVHFTAYAPGSTPLTLSQVILTDESVPPVALTVSSQNSQITITGEPPVNNPTIFLPLVMTTNARQLRQPQQTPALSLARPATMTTSTGNAVRVAPQTLTATSCFAADLDCDLDVDGADVTLAFTSWSCATGDACYTAAFDLDNNGLINVLDVAWVNNEQDSSPPQLSLTTPRPNAVVGSQRVVVSGQVVDKHQPVTVTVNGVTAVVNGSDFTATVDLESGNQRLYLTATDAVGQASLLEQLVRVDAAGPRIDIQSPKPRQAIYTLTPTINVTYSDFHTAVDNTSAAFILSDASGATQDITSQLQVTNMGAQGSLTTPLNDNEVYTLTVQVADTWGNSNTAVSSFYVPANPESITPPPTVESAGWVSGVVYDSATCDDYLQCAGLPGAMVTLVSLETEQPVTGTISTGPDGFFAFPVDDTAVYRLRIEKEGYTYGQREAEIVRERSTATNAIYLTPLDLAVTTCDTAGCLHNSNDGLMQVEIPAGAIPSGETLDVTATNFAHVEFLPSGELPPNTGETYAFDLLGGDEYTFTQPVTVRQANTLNFDPGTEIPVGYWNPDTFAWEHHSTSVVDPTGQWVEMSTTHFSVYDLNFPISPPPNFSPTPNPDSCNDGDCDPNQCPNGVAGCFIDLRSGHLRETLTFPAVQVLDESNAPQLLYNTQRAHPTAVIDASLNIEQPSNGNIEIFDYLHFELLIEGVRTDRFTFANPITEGEVGRFRYLWDGRDAQGNQLPSGVYEYAVRITVPYMAEFCGPMNGEFGNEANCEELSLGVFMEQDAVFTQEGTIELHTSIDSPYGNGWVLADVQRLHEQENGLILITEDNNTVEYYIAAKDQIPNNDPTTLQTNSPTPQRLSQRPSSPFTPLAANAPTTDVSGTIITDTVWTVNESPYNVTGLLTVEDGVTLTIEPGVTVVTNPFQRIRVQGNLVAIGTPTQGITFTATAEGSSNAWLSLEIGGGTNMTDSNASHLQYVTFQNGGAQGFPVINLNNSMPALDNLTIENGFGTGIQANLQSTPNGTFMLTNSLIENSAVHGLDIRYALGGLTITNTVVQNNGEIGLRTYSGNNILLQDIISVNNGEYGLFIDGASNDQFEPRNVTIRNATIENNTRPARLWASTDWDSSVSWANNGSTEFELAGGLITDTHTLPLIAEQVESYRLPDGYAIYVGPEAMLTLDPGLSFYAGHFASIQVAGNLQAIGTAENPIIFSDGNPVRATGQGWGGIRFTEGSDALNLALCHLQRRFDIGSIESIYSDA